MHHWFTGHSVAERRGDEESAQVPPRLSDTEGVVGGARLGGTPEVRQLRGDDAFVLAMFRHFQASRALED